MSAFDDHRTALRRFLAGGGFAANGAFVTDLDGTAVLELEGRIHLPPTVEFGLKRIHDLGRPVIANTLRFPLSVINVFGAEWQRVTGAPLPLVSLKGSQFGQVVRAASGEVSFEEWGATTLEDADVREVLRGVEGIVADGAELLVFHYPRDWRRGERIWTPRPEHVDAVARKYRSASEVFSTPLAGLEAALLAEPLCMIFLLVEVPADRRMAYQHTSTTSFVTRGGTCKRSGALGMAAHLGIALSDSIGAGDASTDDFLDEVGFAVIVGRGELDYKGRTHTARVEGVAQLGELLSIIGDDLEDGPA